MTTLATIVMMLSMQSAKAYDFSQEIPLDQTDSATFHIQGNIEGSGAASMLVDTGSTYTVIDQGTLDQLLTSGHAIYVKNVVGKMADGSPLQVDVYRISSINLGGRCVIRDIEAAIIPHPVRPILGLSALNKVSPFIFATSPPSLAVSNCEGQAFAASGAAGKPGVIVSAN